MKRVFVLSVFLAAFCTAAYSQLREGNSLLGPSLGLSTGPSAPAFGLNYEYQVTGLGNVALLGLGAVVRYTSWRDNYPFADYYNYNYFTLGGQLNVGFNNIANGRFVPFAGLVLGYNNVNDSYVSSRGVVYTASYTSGLWLWGQAGFRYIFSPEIAGGIRFGAGNFNFNILEATVDFKL